jgi:hypothetical protein
MRHLTGASLTQNEEVKRISAWAAILFAPTLVGNIYGMDFDYMKLTGAFAQEELDGLTVEHEVAERPLREPARGVQLAHPLVEARSAQARVEIVELGDVKVCDERHILSLLARVASLAITSEHDEWTEACG